MQDYVDEKLEDAFLSGAGESFDQFGWLAERVGCVAVPVVLAPPSIQDYEPSSTTRSMIIASDFRTPQVLTSDADHPVFMCLLFPEVVRLHASGRMQHLYFSSHIHSTEATSKHHA